MWEEVRSVLNDGGGGVGGDGWAGVVRLQLIPNSFHVVINAATTKLVIDS